MDPVGVASPEPGPAAAWGSSKCPWATPQNTMSCSLADVMSEQLAKELQLEEEAAAFPEVAVVDGPFISGENIDTSSDLMLAQMLQMEFDREYDAQLRREEKNSMEIAKFLFLLKIIEKCIPLKTVIALKMRLTGRTLVMIPTYQQNLFLPPKRVLLEKEKTSPPNMMK